MAQSQEVFEMTGKWNLTLGVVIALLLAAVLAVQLTGVTFVHAAANAVGEPTRQITVAGEGAVSAQPDYARANLGVQVLAPTVDAATQENETKMAALIARLKEQGIADKDIQTSNYDIFPQRNFQNGKPGEITGYQVSNTVQVTIHDLSKVSTILDQATQAGANNVNGVSFGLDNQEKLQVMALDKAVTDAQAQADELAKSSGVARGELLSISQVVTPNPIPFVNATAQADGAVPIQPGEIEVSARVQLTYAIR
jgi:uncharacterized protein YggE